MPDIKGQKSSDVINECSPIQVCLLFDRKAPFDRIAPEFQNFANHFFLDILHFELNRTFLFQILIKCKTETLHVIFEVLKLASNIESTFSF